VRAQAHKVRPTPGEVPSRPGSLLVLHAAELLTVRGPAGPRTRETAHELAVIEDGALYAEGETLVDVGTTADVLARHPRADLRIDATGKVVMPGFVDAHTHPIFAGSRAHEVEWKSQGLSYSEIAARGGGILHTVRETRKASEEDIAREGAKRLHAMASFGTTTIEAKSGYGLRTEDELKVLRAIAQAGRISGLDVVPTFLGAHAIPPEFEGRRADYVDLVAGSMLEAVTSRDLAEFCDVFVDEGYFSAEEALHILTTARDAGLRPRIHADELSDAGGAAVAAKVHATSADHLNRISSEGVDALAGAGVVAVLLPASSLSSHLPFTDGRRLVAAGVPVAIGTDFNANNWCESMPLVLALACHHNGLTAAEAVVGATINAAHAVGREGRVGSLETGKQADVLILDLPSWPHLGYRIGGNAVEVVVKKGRLLVDNRPTS
jgi:imidazolonepropionase